MSNTITVEIPFEQITQIMKQLTPVQKKEIERKLWADQMDSLVSKMRRNARKNKITDKKIYQVCEEVRQELYEKRRN